MFFSLDVLRARKGDCLMLHFGSEQDPHLILIDGGPSECLQALSQAAAAEDP